MPELAVLIPTRGRPGNIEKVISAWDFTNAWDVADMVLIVDADDPAIEGYRALVSATTNPDTGQEVVKLAEMPDWRPMVHKLNHVAAMVAEGGYFALGFAGDDHLPRTINWAKRYLETLHELGTGMVYGDDGYQGIKLSTEWAVTADVVRALGQMVPADVDHMYCDNSIMDLFAEAGALRHLPEVRIEHMHPSAGKAVADDQYRRTGHRDQFTKDRRAYEAWRHGDVFLKDVAQVRHLRRGLPEVRPEKPVRNDRVRSSPRPVTGRARRPIQRSGPTRRGGSTMSRRSPFPRHFRQVRAATPEDIGITLADFAAQVPADQEIVELGVFQGSTALKLAWGAGQGNGAHVTAIDPWDLPGNVYDPPFTDASSRSWAHHWINTFGYADKITLVQGFSADVAAQWVTSSDLIGLGNKPVGLLYVDGDHTKEGARRDIEAWSPHLAPGAIIAVDDYTHPDWPGVREAVDELVAEGLLDPVQLYHDRLAVTRLHVETPEESAAVVDTNLRAAGSQGLTAITSEGVSPSPGTTPTVPGQVAGEGEPDRATLEAEWRRVDPGGVAALEESAAALEARVVVSAGELDDVPGGTMITELNTVQLRALAKVRGIRLGTRKDKRDSMLDALEHGE